MIGALADRYARWGPAGPSHALDPRAADYIVEVLAEYPEFEWLSDWFRVEVQPRVLAQVLEASP